MTRRIGLVAAFLALAGAGFWVTSTVLASDDPLTEGTTIKVERWPDGTVDTYRAQEGGRVVVEHQKANGETWFEDNVAVGHDGKPVICPNGEPLHIDIVTTREEPTPDEIRNAQRGLPDDRRAVFNAYSGKFEIIDSVTKMSTYGEVTISEPLFYQCDENNQPVLVPLSRIDPEAAERARREMKRQLDDSDGLTGLGSDPASSAPVGDGG